MSFKINISEKTGKTFKIETEAENLIGKTLKEKILGKDISSDFNGYEFEITGLSDKSGFTAHEDVEGIGLKRILLTYGKAMRKRPRKEGKKKHSTPRPKGLRLRKTVRGKTISPEIVQINLKVLKEGSKKLSEIFPDQNKSKEEPEKKPANQTKEEPEKEKVETSAKETSQKEIQESSEKKKKDEIKGKEKSSPKE